MDFIVSALRQNPELAIFLTLAMGILSGRLRFGRPNVGFVVGCLPACVGAGTITAALRAVQDEAQSNIPALGYTDRDAIGRHGVRSSWR